MDRHVTRGGEHTTQCTDDVLQNRTPENYNFVNQCHPNKLNRKEKNF